MLKPGRVRPHRSASARVLRRAGTSFFFNAWSRSDARSLEPFAAAVAFCCADSNRATSCRAWTSHCTLRPACSPLAIASLRATTFPPSWAACKLAAAATSSAPETNRVATGVMVSPASRSCQRALHCCLLKLCNFSRAGSSSSSSMPAATAAEIHSSTSLILEEAHASSRPRGPTVISNASSSSARALAASSPIEPRPWF
mmetsp:Transcript_47294/g.86848  ORF Transcript_47294/g.86848 Transcript_47294/m.86848 type:complete len:200 (-) Transcript_47294:125-724(-)